MACEAFKTTNFRDESLRLIAVCNQIVDSYMADGLRLTLRQLYYQLVSANVIANTERSYKNVGKLVSNARLSGLLDWDAIEDRGRQPAVPGEYDSISHLMEAALYSYRLPRLAGQPSYVELWVEKDALAGVLLPVAEEYHVTLMVNKGYSSQSAMRESAHRIADRCGEGELDEASILYLGDMDPSGEDMVRDIQDRLELFLVDDNVWPRVQKVALTMDQVRAEGLPPNPTKLTDSRAKAFIKKYGRESWEVDALPPRTLQRLAREAIESRLDLDLMEQIKRQEESDKSNLRRAMQEQLIGEGG